MNVVFMKNFDLTVWSKLTANKAHFRLLGQKYLINLSRHLVRYIHKKFSSRGLEQNISASLAQNTRSIFLDIMYVVDSNFLDIIPRLVHENLLFRSLEQVNIHKAHFGLLSAKTNDSTFLELMHVRYTKKVVITLIIINCLFHSLLMILGIKCFLKERNENEPKGN